MLTFKHERGGEGPKKWASDAERMATKRAEVNEQKINEQSKRTINWQDIDPLTFPNNGVPVNGFVRVITKVRANLDHDYGVVTKTDFWDRYHNFTCVHDLAGWSCKDCL